LFLPTQDFAGMVYAVGQCVSVSITVEDASVLHDTVVTLVF